MITELFTPAQITAATATAPATKDTEARGMKGFRLWNLSSWYLDVMDVESMRVGLAAPFQFTQGTFERDLTYLRIATNGLLPSLALAAVPSSQQFVFLELTPEELPYLTAAMVPGANPGSSGSSSGASTANPAYTRLQDGVTAALAKILAGGQLSIDLSTVLGSAAFTGLWNSDAITPTPSNPLQTQGLITNFNDGTGFLERQRNNTQGTLLASAARTATTTTPNQTNYNGRGVSLFLRITAAPNTAETLTIQLQELEPVTGGAGNVVASFATGAGSTLQAPPYLYVLKVYPGNTTAPDGAFNKGYALAITRGYTTTILHGGASSWTYSLGGAITI